VTRCPSGLGSAVPCPPGQGVRVRTRPVCLAGQYQQSPTPRKGGIFKREYWQPYVPPVTGSRKGMWPDFDFIVVSVDSAFTEKEDGKVIHARRKKRSTGTDEDSPGPQRARGPHAGAAQEELAALTPEERDGLRWRGIGPGDSYVGIWRLLNLYRMKLVKVQEMMTKHGEGSRSPGSAMSYEEKEQLYLDRIQEIYKALLPHEKAKLQSITHLGDPAHPVYHEVDLKGLPTEDLKALARILPKLGGAAAEPPPSKGKKS
jgi:hypothetical protein